MSGSRMTTDGTLSICRRIGYLLLLTAGLGCSTAPRDFETPAGRRPGDQLGPWIILGVLSRETSTLNRSNARPPFEERVTVNVPPGTELIIPAIQGWITGFGRIEPADLSTFEGTANWHTDDHHLGLSQMIVTVEDINSADTTTTPPTQTARIRIGAVLSDNNGDDPWFGTLRYTLICLGRHP
jgi:hypothetical protein